MNALAPMASFAFRPDWAEIDTMKTGLDFGAIRPQAVWRSETAMAKAPRWRGPLAASLALHGLALAAMLVWTSGASDSPAPEPITVEIVPAPLVAAPPFVEPPPPVAETPLPAIEPPPPAPVAETPPPVAEPPPPPPVAETPPPQAIEPPPPPPVAEAPPPPPVAEPPPPAAEPPPPPVVETPPPAIPEPAPVAVVTPVPQPVIVPPPPAPKPPPVVKATAAPAPKPKATLKPNPSPVRTAEPAPASAPASAPAAASASDVANYRSEVTSRISARKRYPDAALERGPRGLAIVSFTLDGQGQLVAVSLAKSAGDPILDADALATVRRAAPFGPPPAGAPKVYSAPLNYQPR